MVIVSPKYRVLAISSYGSNTRIAQHFVAHGNFSAFFKNLQTFLKWVLVTFDICILTSLGITSIFTCDLLRLEIFLHFVKNSLFDPAHD